MRHAVLGVVGILGLCGSLAFAQQGGGRGGRTGGDGQTVILEKAPTDHAIPIPKAKLNQYVKDMDAKKLQTLRMIEGGKFNVNIRRITNAETAVVHPTTIDLWMVIDGSGTLTTGGKVENGKIVGGQAHPLKVGDVEFIPAGLPHGVSGVSGNITWLNVRWDVDWPPDAPLGAGTLPGRGRGEAGGGRADGPALAPVEYATTGHSIAIPNEKLDSNRQVMEAKNLSTLRMIEGGHFNVNIRRIKAPSIEIHPLTIDTWVVLEGSGTVTTGFQRAQDGKMVAGTGVSQPVKTGDVMFVPANLPHGFSTVDGTVAWLNIRWDVNWEKK